MPMRARGAGAAVWWSRMRADAVVMGVPIWAWDGFRASKRSRGGSGPRSGRGVDAGETGQEGRCRGGDVVDRDARGLSGESDGQACAVQVVPVGDEEGDGDAGPAGGEGESGAAGSEKREQGCAAHGVLLFRVRH